MKQRRSIRSWTVQMNQNATKKEVSSSMKRVLLDVSLVMVAALLISMLPMQGFAAVDCAAPGTGDFDLDGFSNLEECIGLTIASGAKLDYPGCFTNPALPRNECLDPNTKDLFVILVPAAASLIPVNPFEYVAKTLVNYGLNITVHQISAADVASDRYVTATQKAVRIAESLEPLTSDSDPVGVANYGTPNGLDLAAVYTKRIETHVTSVCGTNTCVDADQVTTGVPNLINKYIKHTIAHEIGHMMKLTTAYNERYGGYHYQTGTNVVMEQFIKYTTKGTKTTYSISSKFTSPDQTGAVLH